MTIEGKNEIYNRENLVRPFLVHQVLGPKPPPPFPPPAQKKPWSHLSLVTRGGGGGLRGGRGGPLCTSLQVNPHVIPFLDAKFPNSNRGHLETFLLHLKTVVLSEVKHWALQAHRLGLVPAGFRPLISMLDQKYLGSHVNILPVHSLAELGVLLANPTQEYMEHCISQAQRRTWPHLTTIKYHTRLEIVIGQCFEAVMMGLMEEYERITQGSRPASECCSVARASDRKGSDARACGGPECWSVCSSLSGAGSSALPSADQSARLEAQSSLADSDLETELEDDDRKRRDSRHVLERIHTFHPQKRGRTQSARLTRNDPSATTLSAVSPTLSATKISHSDVGPVQPRLHGDLTRTSSLAAGPPRPTDSPRPAPAAPQSRPGTGGRLPPMPLDKVLDWIEWNVRAEHKMKVAQYAIEHTQDIAAIIQSVFDRKEELVLKMIANPCPVQPHPAPPPPGAGAPPRGLPLPPKSPSHASRPGATLSPLPLANAGATPCAGAVKSASPVAPPAK